MDPAVSERQATTRLGSFEVVRKLTRGGMAEIFLARTRGPSGFEKLVVLKKILPKYAGRQRYVQLFLDEARLAASLDHPNIVHVYDIGMVDGSYFFTMEYLHGQDVRTILHRAWRTGDRLPFEDAVQVARNVASALHFAHEKQRDDGSLLGIVHRDVSPSNIIVTYDGATKLLDFGVAKTTTSSVKTRTGTLKGKVAYMSPEQARGLPLDRRSDIFSLGIVLWEMVTTQRLYRMDNDLATLQAIITQPAKSPKELRPDCPPELERIVLRALAREPADRYQTAEQMVSDLDELAREHKLKQTPSALTQTLAQLFAPEVAAWREARAAGVPLADHLTAAAEATTPVSESDFVAVEDVELDDEDLDDLDDDDDDDDLTEHAGPIVDPLPPLRESRPELAPANGDVDTVMLRPISPSGIHVATGTGSSPTTSPTLTALPKIKSQGTPGPLPVTPPTTTGRPPIQSATLEALEALRVRGPAADPDATEAAGAPHHDDNPPLLDPDSQPPTMLHLTRPGEDPMAGDEPLPGELGAMATPPPIVPVPPRFAVPPWQSGQPTPTPTPAPHGAAPPHRDPTARSWALVELPPFDPEVFERRRRVVIRVASGVVAFVLLLAIVAGRC